MAEPVVRGWCPGALRPMASGDGLVVRLRPRGGRLSADTAAGIAALAGAHGNGLLDLTSRANLQLRGVTEASYPRLLDGLAALGLLDETAQAEARRNIVIQPFWSPGDGTQDIAAALAAALGASDAPELPGKFGFAVDCGPLPVLRRVSADIRLERAAAGGLICRADGASAGRRVTAETAASAAVELSHWFVRSGGVELGRGRMSPHLARGAALPETYLEAPAQSDAASAPHPGPVAAGYLVGLEFGQLDAETLAAVASLGALRMTPWRLLLIEGARTAPDMRGLITRHDDPMLRVVACTGAPGCPQAAQPTRPLARTLARHVSDGAILHISGCAKGCAHPAAASTTLVACAEGFDLIRNGCARDASQRRGLTHAFLAAHPEILVPEALAEAP